MNIRKWVNFVVNPSSSIDKDEAKIEQPEMFCLHRFPAEIFGERILSESVQDLETSVQSFLAKNSSFNGQVSIDVFDAAVDFLLTQDVNSPDLHKVGVLLESWLYQSPYLKQAKSPPPFLLTEVDYSRMRQFGIYKFGCLIEYELTAGERRRGLDDIVSDIRAIPTVTIVSVVLANEKISTGRYVAGLQIKFIPSFPGNLSQPEEAKAYILRMIKKIKNVRGISRVSLKTDRVEE